MDAGAKPIDARIKYIGHEHLRDYHDRLGKALDACQALLNWPADQYTDHPCSTAIRDTPVSQSALKFIFEARNVLLGFSGTSHDEQEFKTKMMRL